MAAADVGVTEADVLASMKRVMQPKSLAVIGGSALTAELPVLLPEVEDFRPRPAENANGGEVVPLTSLVGREALIDGSRISLWETISASE